MSVRPVSPWVTRHGLVLHTYDEYTDAAACGELDPDGLPAYRLPGRDPLKLRRPLPSAAEPSARNGGNAPRLTSPATTPPSALADDVSGVSASRGSALSAGGGKNVESRRADTRGGS